MARPKRKEIDKLRTKVWYLHLESTLGKENAYQMDKYFESDTNRNWYKYRDGIRVPTHATLAFVERTCPGSREIFDSGPKKTQLWKALYSDYEVLWDVVDDYYPQYKDLRLKECLGLLQYMNFIDNDLIIPQYSCWIDYIEFAKDNRRNVVSKAISENLIYITPHQFACFIACWRFCVLVNYNLIHGEYLLGGIWSGLNGRVFGQSIDKLLNEYIEKVFLKSQSNKKIF